MVRKTRNESSLNEDLGPEIGAALQHWNAFLDGVRTQAPDVEIAWKTYAGKTGKQCVIRGKDRNLAYLKPGDGSFLFSTALSESAVAALSRSNLPKALIAEVEAATKYREGTPARVRIDSAKTLKDALTLLAIKIADGSVSKGSNAT